MENHSRGLCGEFSTFRSNIKALQHHQAVTNQFFGVLTGVVAMSDFFSPRNMIEILGAGGMLKILAHHLLKLKIKAGQPQTTQSSVTAG